MSHSHSPTRESHRSPRRSSHSPQRSSRVDFSKTQRPHDSTPGKYLVKVHLRDDRRSRSRSYERRDRNRYERRDTRDRDYERRDRSDARRISRSVGRYDRDTRDRDYRRDRSHSRDRNHPYENMSIYIFYFSSREHDRLISRIISNTRNQQFFSKLSIGMINLYLTLVNNSCIIW